MHDVFHVLQLKLAVGYDGSNANAADVPAFRPAADESGEYEVEDILDIALVGVVIHYVWSILSSGVGTLCLSQHENLKLT